MREPIHEAAPDADWQKLRPALDEAMHGLKETDREAVLLRYFENRAFVEVGAKLNLSENAARMRVDRAVEKLRSLLAKRGITTTAALAAVISANAVQVAPAGTVSALTVSSLAAAGTRVLTLEKIMTMTKLKLCLGTLALAGVTIALVMQHRASRMVRAENKSNPVPINPSPGSNRLVTDDPAPMSAGELDELLKQRAEATRSQAAKNESIVTEALVTNNLQNPRVAIQLNIKFIYLPAADVQSLRPALAPADNGIGVLSGEQLRFVDEALHGETNIYRMRITTLSGQNAQASLHQEVTVNNTNANTGVAVDVTPRFSSDSSLFNISLAAYLTQLTGDPSQPGLQTIQTSTNQVALFPGQTAVLQKDIPTRGWLPNATNTLDEPGSLLVFVTPVVDTNSTTQPSQSPPQNAASREAAMQKMNDARQGVLALIMYASENQAQFPTNLAQASAYINDGSVDEIATNFDLVCPAFSTNIESPSTTIVLREKQSWQSPAGNWLKGYGFADGHAEIHTEPNGNFDDYEKKHTVLPLPTQ